LLNKEDLAKDWKELCEGNKQNPENRIVPCISRYTLLLEA